MGNRASWNPCVRIVRVRGDVALYASSVADDGPACTGVLIVYGGVTVR